MKVQFASVTNKQIMLFFISVSCRAQTDLLRNCYLERDQKRDRQPKQQTLIEKKKP